MEDTFLIPENLEDKLIIYSARTEIDAYTKKKIKKLLKKDLDWNYLIISACRNSVSQFVYYQINRIYPERIPKTYLSILKDDFDWGLKYNLLLSSELLKILKLLISHNIPVVPYAGPVLANRIYGNLALKEINWMDLIIDEKYAQKSKEILLQQGFELKHSPKPGKEHAYMKSVHEYIFIKEKGLIQINLRWNYLKKSFSAPENIETIWDYKKMIPVVFNRFKIFNPSIEQLFIILSIECVNFQWTRLGYICDIAELVRNNDYLDWNKIFETAKKFKIEKIIFINLFLINELLGVNIPKYIIDKIEGDQDIRKISIKLIKRLFTHNDYLIKMRRENHVDSVLRYQIRENKYYGIKDFLNNLTSSSPYKTYKPHTQLSYIGDIITKPLNLFIRNISGKYPMITVPEPYVVTPTKLIIRMLQMAEIGSNDIVYDLGCGDGRFLITAAEKFSVKGVGIDLEPERIRQSKINAQKKGVENLTTFLEEDIMKSDISDATIVTLYHLPSINLAIRSKLKKELKPNTRIVTREFSMGEWPPVKTEIVSNEGIMVPIYLYKT